MVAVLKPDHVRDVDLFVRRYGARAFGPRLFFRDDVPETALEPIEPGDHSRWAAGPLRRPGAGGDTPLAPRAAHPGVRRRPDGAGEGPLRVWASRWHEERALPALRELLALPFERVIVSHGQPVHDQAAFERALALPPWTR